MPKFDTTPPSDLGRSGYRLIRTPANSPLFAHVLSEQLVGCKTHFVGNRTIPCEAPDCESCNSGVPWRWHGYLAIVIESTREIVIFETTARAAAAFTDYHQRYGTTRGCHLKAQRLNNRTNGRVLIQARPSDLAKINLPPAPNVEKLLCHIWNISEKQVTINERKPRPPHEDIKIDRTTTETTIPIDRAGQSGHDLNLAEPRRGNGRTAR